MTKLEKLPTTSFYLLEKDRQQLLYISKKYKENKSAVIRRLITYEYARLKTKKNNNNNEEQ